MPEGEVEAGTEATATARGRRHRTGATMDRLIDTSATLLTCVQLSSNTSAIQVSWNLLQIHLYFVMADDYSYFRKANKYC